MQKGIIHLFIPSTESGTPINGIWMNTSMNWAQGISIIYHLHWSENQVCVLGRGNKHQVSSFCTSLHTHIFSHPVLKA